jgi:hypothetical protein
MEWCRALIAAGTSVWVLLGGCASTSKQGQLEAIAKDWSMVIRASQVLPIYPLTEDIQPGDVFLVQTPIDKQHEIYTKRGFLPFDNHLGRINPDGYKPFYERSFQVGDPAATPPTTLPRRWMKPDESKLVAWSEAPQAGFPTYDFSVKRGGGFSGALPVQGVPVGLSLLGTDTADGSITIDKARTYGVDTVTLYEQLKSWSVASQNATFLKYFAPHDGKTNYLRVVSRVYLTGRLIVTLMDTSSRAAGASVGVKKAVDDLFAPEPAGAPSDHTAITTARYTEGLKKIEESMASALATIKVNGVDQVLPGATLKIVAASSRSITTAETFIDRPLVIGYLGFDVAIGPNGILGPPIPTRAVLEQGAVPVGVFSTVAELILIERQHIEQSGRESKILEGAAGKLGGAFKTAFDKHMSEGMNARVAFGVATLEYIKDEQDQNGPKRWALLVALQSARAAH